MLQALLLVIGLFYGALLEYGGHRFVFHKLGKRRGSRFAFHWYDHHSTSRRNRMIDPAFHHWALRWDACGRELMGLMMLLVTHAPLALVAPGFYAGAATYAALYHYVHRRSHVEPEWGLRWCPWHVAHHIGLNQDVNYGVVTDLIDRLAGTRRLPSKDAAGRYSWEALRAASNSASS